MVGAHVRLPPRTRVTTPHTSLNQTIQSTKPSPDLQPKAGLEGSWRTPSGQGGWCVSYLS
jgi:hypothetical protein